MARAKHSSGAADPDLERGPEVDATWLGVVGQPAIETRRQRREDMATDEVVQLGRGRNPGAKNPGRGSRRNKPARYSEEQTVESVRNAVGGTEASRDARREWTRWTDAAMRNETPRKAPEPGTQVHDGGRRGHNVLWRRAKLIRG
jgi:hypothetical protein